MLTIESSGIAPAVYTAQALKVPMVILKKQTSKTLNGQVFQTNITSFTKGTSYELTLSRDYIHRDDRVLIIDDFLANGEAATGAAALFRWQEPPLPELVFLSKNPFKKDAAAWNRPDLTFTPRPGLPALAKVLLNFCNYSVSIK